MSLLSVLRLAPLGGTTLLRKVADPRRGEEVWAEGRPVVSDGDVVISLE